MDYNNILVSIIVPVYNVENYLNKCIESILSQTHKNLEVIFVNDGSIDKSLEILKKYAKKDKRIIIVSQENKGVSTARNVGIDRARGEYICFSDADDYLMPDYVEYLLKLALDNDADISLTKDMFTTFYPDQITDDFKEIYTAEQATIDILSYNIPIGVYCKMFKRSFLGTEIRFIPEIFIGEGFNFNTTAFQRANKIAIGRRRIYFYRRDNPISATTQFSIRKWENALFAIKNIHNNLIIKTNNIETAWRYANWHTHCDAFNFMVCAKADKTYHKEYCDWKSTVRNQAKYSIFVNIRFRERIRAIIMVICPRMMPWLIMKRYKKYGIK